MHKQISNAEYQCNTYLYYIIMMKKKLNIQFLAILLLVVGGLAILIYASNFLLS